MDDQTKDAIRRLTSNPDFQRYIDHLRAKRDEVVTMAMTETDPPCLYRYQGSHSALNGQLQDIARIHDVRPPAKPRRIV